MCLGHGGFGQCSSLPWFLRILELNGRWKEKCGEMKRPLFEATYQLQTFLGLLFSMDQVLNLEHTCVNIVT